FLHMKEQLTLNDQVIDQAKDLQGRWTSLSFTTKRQIIEHILEAIIIGEEDISIQLNYLPFANDKSFAFETTTENEHNPRDS
ncbi:MAG: hypothetical protein AAFU60_03635, partial [Bacteroidota bacterium]